ncbi:CinA family protein [Limimonas halophila]|nr:nicotinamide-nucleotide amidohydrolase family protein [Limimonas halophila]
MARERAGLVLAACRARGWALGTAESCTGGLVSAALTAVPGASAVMERGLVTYTNAAKMDLLDVPAATLETHGAVSAPVAEAMAAGLLARAPVQAAVSVTGIAGPNGGTPLKPVGLVYVGAATTAAGATHRRTIFAGDRDTVRSRSVAVALDLLLDLVA